MTGMNLIFVCMLCNMLLVTGPIDLLGAENCELLLK